MGLWNTQFGGATFVGVLPPDFDEPYHAYALVQPTQEIPSGGAGSNVVGDYVVWGDDNGTAHKLLRWMRPETHDDLLDTDQLLLWMPTEAPGNQICTLWCRSSGGDGSENGYYIRVGEGGGDSNMTLAEITAGTPSTLVSVTPIPDLANIIIDTSYWLQLRVVGDRLQVRCWEYGTPVPPKWHIDTTDSTYTAAGSVGIGSSSTVRIEYDYYSLGTGGDSPQYIIPVAAGPSNLNSLLAIWDEVQTDATVLLFYTGEPNVAVDWALTGDGTITVLTAQTDAAGKAWARYTPGTVGPHNIDVTVGIPA